MWDGHRYPWFDTTAGNELEAALRQVRGPR
jgi:hypothetical protein